MKSPCNVDVLVGGQWGSEGKGNIVAKIADKYQFLVRTGGPNAGHTVWKDGKKHVFRHLPSGSLHSPKARLILGAGSVIHVPTLLKEMEDNGIERGRVVIDPQAVIISELHREVDSEAFANISTTGQGVGSATISKIAFANISTTGQGVGSATISKIHRSTVSCRLAATATELYGMVYPTVPLLQDPNGKILVEGTQGVLLSLHHGSWPYVTSRDTSPSGVLAEAGIPPTRVRRVIMVVRTFPIRVANPPNGTSGPMDETTWEMVAQTSGRYSADELRQREMTTTTHRLRRVGHFTHEMFMHGYALCAPTDLAVTFMDYIHPANQPTFLRHLGFKVSTPVSFISKGPLISDIEWSNEGTW